MRVGSLFSGIAGFDLGLNLPVSWQVEKDKDCNRVLTHHFPETERFKDVQTVGKENLTPVDLICGGFPCQDLSVAGKRAGLDGERSGLWFEFHRIIRELSPQWVLIENVPGLLSSNAGRDFAIILSGLAEFGYSTAWRILDAQYFGVPQRRRRVFIVGSFGNASCAEVLFESSCCCGDTPPSREAGERVAPTISKCFKGSGGIGMSNQKLFSQMGDSLITPDDVCAVPDPAYALAAGTSGGKIGHGRDAQDTYVATFPVGVHKGFAPASMPVNEEQGLPLDATRIQGVISNTTVRRLTPTECLRLQGFPDDWLDLTPPLSDSAKYRMVGNAVAVPVIRWIGRRIMEVHKQNQGERLSRGKRAGG